MDQGVNNIDLIVIDDWSTDDTKDVFEPLHERIRYIYQDNRGVRESQGALLAFLDSDDILS